MNKKRFLLVVGVVIAVVVVIALLKGGGLRAPSVGLVSRDLTLPNANVLMITLDTTRADRIGAYGYASAETPRLDRLAGEGVLFEEATTPTAFTLPSHASIMTGLYPPYHGVRLNGGSALADVHSTLAERLAESGYRCGAVMGAFVLDQRWGLSQGFGVFDDEFEMEPAQILNLAGVQRPADRVVDVGLEWLDQPDERPFFAWLHLYDPHTPYEPPEPYGTRFGGRGMSGLYDGEIAFTDSQVGRLLDGLDDRGLAENTIVVVVGDHGESLGEHGETEHGYCVCDATVKVPLIVRIPGADLEDIRVPAQVRTIDVMPTVLDLVGVEKPEPLHGQSLVPLMVEPGGESPDYAYSESMSVHLQYGWSALYSIRTTEHKFIDAPRAELYALGDDPAETKDLIGDLPDVAEELRSVLEILRLEIEAGAPEVQEADLDEETLGMLAALGYVGGATAAPEGANLADPKDTIHLFEGVNYASNLMLGEDYEEAAETLEMVLGDDPEIPQAMQLLATCYRNLARTAEAKVLLDAFLRDHPDNTSALITMAGILTEEGAFDEVAAIAKRVLAVDDRNAEAYALMAGAAMNVNDHSAALPLLERAVEIQPKLTRNRLNLAVANVGLGRLGEAEPILVDILAEKPKFPLANFHLGLLYEEQGRLGEARAAYAKEVELYPDSVMARFNLGNLYFRLGDLEAAEREMRILIDEASEKPKPYLFLARVLLKGEMDLAEVERLARAGLERTEADDLKVLGYYLLADVYSRQGRQAELEQVLERALYYRSRIEGAGG
jgi:arylsulfatase A-like enzyme/thioredoxin-like negative regulator of GroEL